MSVWMDTLADSFSVRGHCATRPSLPRQLLLDRVQFAIHAPFARSPESEFAESSRAK